MGSPEIPAGIGPGRLKQLQVLIQGNQMVAKLAEHMKVSDLQFSTLFEPRVEEGRILFNHRRAILLDVEAMSALRQQLLDNLGEELATGILARFGFAHGYADAKKLGETFSWATEADWLSAGPFLHMLQGIALVTTEKIEFSRLTGHFHMQGFWRNSYEAEIHLQARGRSAHPVCWTLAGYASGYSSSFFGRDLLAVETQCMAQGGFCCRWEIRPVEHWGAEAEPYRKALKAVDVITQLRQMELTGARFRDMALSCADWVWETDGDGRFEYCSGAVENTLGYQPAQMAGRFLFDFLPPEEAVRIRCIFREKVLLLKPFIDLELRALTRDGGQIVLSLSGVPAGKGGGRIKVRGVAKDITERKQAEEALEESRERFRALVETTSDWVWEVNEKGVYTYVSPRVREILGYGPEELLGKTPFDFMPPDEAERIAGVFRELAAARKPFFLLQNVNLHRNGSRVILETSGVPFVDGSGELRGYRGIDRDITARKQAEETIRYQTYHDLLTGLPNRAQLVLRLDLEIAEMHRSRHKLAVLHLNLDRFRSINDSLGHAVGDQLIVAVAEQVKSLLREGDLLARIGNDEFIILLGGLTRAEEAALFARKTVSAVRRTYQVAGHELYITASIGISMYPEDAGDAEGLLRKADIAVSHVKRQGRNNFQFFNPAINIRTVERLLLESSLRRAIERGELVVHYQPLVSIRTGEVLCLEALTRWKHTDLGLLDPAEFIPVAEEIGFITSIDEWVLWTACKQNRKWQEAGYPPLCVTVNLSAQQFHQPSLVEMISTILRETGLEPECLDIEVTESTAMRDVDLAIPNLQKLEQLGIKLSIDDFGTGYSSLNYLKRFPVHSLKIDQSFISDLDRDPGDQAIVKAVIAMGHNLQLRVIAEGVETAEQLAFLKENGCDGMQGFLFSKPLPAEELTVLLTGRG